MHFMTTVCLDENRVTLKTKSVSLHFSSMICIKNCKLRTCMVVLIAFNFADIHGNTQATMQKLVNFIILKLDKSTISESEIGLKIFVISEMAKKRRGISELGPPLGSRFLFYYLRQGPL